MKLRNLTVIARPATTTRHCEACDNTCHCEGAKRPKQSQNETRQRLLRPLCVLAMTILICGIAFAEDWQVVKSQHFLVYYLQDKAFAVEASRRAEKYYRKIASALGYSRYDKFWQWENRAKVYIYPTQEEFVAGTGVPRKWANGMAKYDERTIISYSRNMDFLDALLPHELTHLIFRDFVGYPASGGGIPLWMDEGVAQWQEKGKKEKADKVVKALIAEKRYIPVADLMRLDVRKEDDKRIARDFYAEAVSLVAFLIDSYGGSKFTLFCRRLRDGESVNDALSFVYKNSINDINELEKKWLKYYGG